MRIRKQGVLIATLIAAVLGLVVQKAFTIPAPPPSLTISPSEPVNGVIVTMSGAPYVQYSLYATTNLAAPESWELIGVFITGSNGAVSYTNVGAFELYPQRFYTAQKYLGN